MRWPKKNKLLKTEKKMIWYVKVKEMAQRFEKDDSLNMNTNHFAFWVELSAYQHTHTCAVTMFIVLVKIVLNNKADYTLCCMVLLLSFIIVVALLIHF